MTNLFRRFALGFAVLLISACSVTGSKLVVGSEAPYTKFMKLDGSYILTDDLKGKTSVIVFWASWCNNSRPVLQRLNQYFLDKLSGKDVELIAVSIDKAKDLPKLEEAIKYQKIEAFQHCHSGNDVYDESFIAFDGGTLPHIFIVDPNGKIAGVGHRDSLVYEYFGIER